MIFIERLFIYKLNITFVVTDKQDNKSVVGENKDNLSNS